MKILFKIYDNEKYEKISLLDDPKDELDPLGGCCQRFPRLRQRREGDPDRESRGLDRRCCYWYVRSSNYLLPV